MWLCFAWPAHHPYQFQAVHPPLVATLAAAATETAAAPAAEDPPVGLGGAASPDGATIDKLGEDQDASYEADFADETAKVDESGTFEDSQP